MTDRQEVGNQACADVENECERGRYERDAPGVKANWVSGRIGVPQFESHDATRRYPDPRSVSILASERASLAPGRRRQAAAELGTSCAQAQN